MNKLISKYLKLSGLKQNTNKTQLIDKLKTNKKKDEQCNRLKAQNQGSYRNSAHLKSKTKLIRLFKKMFPSFVFVSA